MQNVKYFKISVALILTLSLAFAFFQRAALANFVQNAWQGYKLTEGLVGYWSFDGKDIDLSQVTAEVRDRSGQGNNGDWVSHATTTVIGKIGQGIDFDGVDDSINLGDVAAVDTAATLSSCSWVKHDTLSGDDGILAKATAGATDGFVFFRDDVGSVSGRTDTYTIVISDSTDASTARIEGATGASKASTWTHVCFTFETSATGLHLYVNGVEDANSPVSTTAIAAIDGGSQALEIGNNSLSALFDGAIDETRLYTRVLSADEIKRLYLMGASLKTNVTHRDELTEGLVGNWTFDGKDIDLSQVTAEVRDGSGQGNNGDWQNHATTTTIGMIGQAITFDGVDDGVEISAAAWNGTLNNYTYSAWAKFTSFSNDNTLVTHGSRSYLHVNTLGKPCFYNYISSTEYDVCSTTILSTGVWYHIVGIKSSVGGFIIYVNGNLVLSDASVPLTSDFDPWDFDYPGIGRNHYDGTIYSFMKGAIDEVRLYNRTLSADEVKRLYLMGASLKTNVTHRDELTEGLVGNWTFDGRDMVQNVADVSVQGNNGMLVGQVSTTTTIGKIGQGLLFDGVNDYVDVGSSVPTLSGDGTICAWVKPNAAGDYRHVITRASGTGNDWEFGAGGAGGPGDRIPYYGQNGAVLFSFVTVILDNAWTQLCLTISASTGAKAYENADQTNSNAGITAFRNANGTVHIANRSDGAAHFPGAIDDVRIYNRALSADEINRLYLMGK